MKLLSFRIRAISVFTFDAGMSTRRCLAPQALRIRVSISAIGSVMLILSRSSLPPYLPVGDVRESKCESTCFPLYQLALRTPGISPSSDIPRKQIRQRPNFRRNARERPQRWQRLCCRTWNFGLRLLFSIIALRAIASLSSRWLRGADGALVVFAAERHAELPQERERLVVTLGRRDERDVHPVDLLDHVVVDLREDHLLLHA